MADRDELKLADKSEHIGLFDNNGAIANLTKVSQLWQDIQQQQKKYLDDQLVSALSLEQLLEDERAKTKAAQTKAVENRKQILKIELEIAKAQDNNDKKLLKNLEKRKKLVEATQAVEKKTQQIVDKYSEDMTARENLRKAQKEAQEQGTKIFKDGLHNLNFKEMFDGAKLGLTGGESGRAGVLKALDTMTSTLADLVKKLDKSIEEIARYKSDWDTRLFGSDSSHSSLTSAIQHALGASPYARQSDVLKQIDKAVDLGIAYNIEQRAFLETIKDDIAGTFDAFDSTLLQIIRIQQQDSTASRMGMEVALNEFFNKTYKNTEYLTNVSDSVTQALYEATSLLTAQQSVSFEYQVQKWLGSLYSVGMSNQGVSSIAQALGQLAAGDVSGTSSGAGKLLVMAASRAGMSYSDLLTKGINDSTINDLMEQMVEYLSTIANSNKVVQSQLANIYGLRTSDIQAVANLTTSDMKSIYSQNLNYDTGLSKLNQMAKTIGSRMNQGEMMTNLIDNFRSTLATGIANNPVLYGLWSMSNMLDQLVGGIPIPSIGTWAVGTGGQVDLETTVADLMRVGALSGSLLSGIGSLVSGLGNNSQGLKGVLDYLKVGQGEAMRTKGNGFWGATGITTSTSQISYIGNASGSDVQESIMTGAEDQKKELLIENQDQTSQEEQDIKLKDLNATTESILELLRTVIINGVITVRQESGIFAGLH